MSDLLDFLNSIEGHGYGGMASFEIARAQAADMQAALSAAILQIEYLHEKFKVTGSGEATLAIIRAALIDEQGNSK